jgi:hypothetical protein
MKVHRNKGSKQASAAGTTRVAKAEGVAAPKAEAPASKAPASVQDHFGTAAAGVAAASQDSVLSSLMRAREARRPAQTEAADAVAAVAADEPGKLPSLKVTSRDPNMFSYVVENKFIWVLGAQGDDQLQLKGGKIGVEIDGKSFSVTTRDGQKASEALAELTKQILDAGYEIVKRNLHTTQPGGGTVEVSEWSIKYRAGNPPGGNPPGGNPPGGNPPKPPPTW